MIIIPCCRVNERFYFLVLKNKFDFDDFFFKCVFLYSVETTYGINSVMSKLMTFVENAETGQFLFLIVLILSSFTCSWHHPFLSYDDITNFFKWEPPLFSSVSDRPFYYLNDE
jgi:hypothetical protein